jgi:hypothetical protein
MLGFGVGCYLFYVFADNSVEQLFENIYWSFLGGLSIWFQSTLEK